MSDERAGKGGRPRKGADDLKSVVSFRIARGELQRLEAAASASGQSRTDYIRGAIEGEMSGKSSMEMSPGEYMRAMRVLGDLAAALERLPEGADVEDIEGHLRSFRARLDSVRLGPEEPE